MVLGQQQTYEPGYFSADIKIYEKTNRDNTKLRNLLDELKGKVTDYETQIAQLKTENEQLTTNNQHLTVERDSLNTNNTQLTQNLTSTQQEKAHVEDVASTLHASNINIAAIRSNNFGFM